MGEDGEDGEDECGESGESLETCRMSVPCASWPSGRMISAFIGPLQMIIDVIV